MAETLFNTGASTTLCVCLSAVGSLSYVCSIMAVAWPQYLVRTQRGGVPFQWPADAVFLLLYVAGQGGAAGFSMAASWFGPVAVSLPIYMSSMLLWNLVVMSALGMQHFTKQQRVGTAVLVVATSMLIEVGPTDEGVQRSAAALFRCMPALWWMTFMGCLWLCSLVGMLVDVLAPLPLGETSEMVIYVFAQGTATSAVTTLGKLLVMVEGATLGAVMLLLGATAAANMYSCVMAARKLNQAEFIPLASCCSLLLNQATGMVLWEDWRTVHLWVSYIGIHALIVLGTYSISSAHLHEFVRESRQERLSGISRHLSNSGKIKAAGGAFQFVSRAQELVVTSRERGLGNSQRQYTQLAA
jgi:hypothetical protein